MMNAPVNYEIKFLCLEPELEKRIFGTALFDRLKIAAMNDGFSDIQYQLVIHKITHKEYGITTGPVKNGKVLVVFPVEYYVSDKNQVRIPSIDGQWQTLSVPVTSNSWAPSPITKEIFDLIGDALAQCSRENGTRITETNLEIDRRATFLIARKTELIVRANQPSLNKLSVLSLSTK